MTLRPTLLAYFPVALAIAVFGAIYGAAATPLIGAGPALLSSAVIFSGALQFAMVGLLQAGASTSAMLAAAVILNLRHLLLGAAVRARVGGGILRRAGLAWFLVDETAGFALAARGRPAEVLLLTGALSYAAWVLGTAAGVAGARLTALGPVAEVLFPVLFVGLTGLAATRGDLAMRALASALLTLAAVRLLPEARAIAPLVAVALAVLPERRGA